MSERKHENKEEQNIADSRLAIPFFVVLAVLTVVSFIIPLRPDKSYTEKRALAEFPEFSMSALASGSYFDDITTWFSDTFPGREEWLKLSSSINSLHGYSEISIQGDLPIRDTVQETSAPTEPTETEATETEATEYIPPETIVLQETTPPTTPVEEWGGVKADEAEITMGSVIQIGDAAFGYCAFSQLGSDRYIKMANNFVDALHKAELDVNVVICPLPTSIGIMVEEDFQEKLNCARQDEIIDYMLGGMSDEIHKVDVFQTLVDHNDEYIYFRTDHHWTALGAYYAYTDICQSLGYDAASLDDFDLWDEGAFEGSLYWKASDPRKLDKDTLYAYNPRDNIKCMIYDNGGYGFEWPLLYDRSGREENTKYMTFLSGDHALVTVENNDLPDAPNCVVIKDSFGNAMIPFLTQNYHNIYVIDYRDYRQMKMTDFIVQYEISDVILLNNLNGAQNGTTNDWLDSLCR